MPVYSLHIIRTLWALFFLVLMSLAFLGVLKGENCAFDFGKMFAKSPNRNIHVVISDTIRTPPSLSFVQENFFYDNTKEKEGFCICA